ncbi:MAG: tRNA lysidine(34) synthetase TilS [Ignavibacteria bacterium RIFOXYA2_FULL_35_10]|nr:MAG: tRNA lysidine(34) synthetase TilS [Ignavibacteria bacterium RIFOXYA2_FULL_35_10]
MKNKLQKVDIEKPDKKEDSQFTDILIKRVENFLFNELYIEDGDRILIAVSGGVDSVTLLDIMYRLSKFHNFKIFPVHFNHKLRGKQSDEDEKFTKKISTSYRLEFFSGTGDVRQYASKNSLSIEHSARILRYNFLERAAQHFNCSMVATAHTLDDMTETFFLNLLRGTGLTGLCGIPKKRYLTKKIFLIRPLINISKYDLKTYAGQRGIKWREDETNLLMNFTRNKIRGKLLPFIKNEFEPSINDKIYRTTKLLTGADRFVSEYIDSFVDKITFNKTTEGFSIKLSMFNNLDEFIQGELLQHLITTKYHQPALPMNLIDRIKNMADSNIGTIVDISKDLYALRDRNSLIIGKRKKNLVNMIEIEKPTVVDAPTVVGAHGEYEIEGNKIILSEVKKKSVRLVESGSIEFLDFDLLPSRLIIRRWQKGDTFIPLGMKGKMKISDFLINNKISLIDKQDILLLTTGKDIIWVCGLRIDDRFKITVKTTRYLRAELIKCK